MVLNGKYNGDRLAIKLATNILQKILMNDTNKNVTSQNSTVLCRLLCDDARYDDALKLLSQHQPLYKLTDEHLALVLEVLLMSEK